MATVDLTNITPPRVPIIDQRTGLISREWYRFFLNLFQLVGGGQNTTSLTDLQLGPPTAQQEDLTDIIIDIVGLQTQSASGTSELQATLDVVRQELQTLPSAAVDELRQQLDVLRQDVQTQRQPELGSMAPLQQANLPWVTFDTTPQSLPIDIGTVAWDGGTTLGIQMTANVLQPVGEAQYFYIKADSTITKGQLIMFTGAVGASGVIRGAPATGLTDGQYLMGIAAEDIASNGFGLITSFGHVRGWNTTGAPVGETWADGDILYYNPLVAGGLTKTQPTAPNVKATVAVVVNAAPAGSGDVFVRVSTGSVLGGTDSNVQFGTLANNDLIQYDSVAQYWKNVAPSSIVIGTATNLAGGAAGSVPYQTAPGTTTFLGIGTALQVLKVNAGATAPEWVSGAALTKTDDTNVTLTLGGTPTTSLLAATSLTLGWTGQLAVSRGGTGVATATANYVFAGPTTGSAAAPTFRALVAADIPTLPYQPTAAPVTYTANFSVATTDVWIINNKSGSSCTATLPTASSYSGRVLRFQNYQAQTLVSASSNVVPVAGGAASTSILLASAGDQCTLVSDGTNWIMTQYIPNNALLLE